jgi:hypothetical protein
MNKSVNFEIAKLLKDKGFDIPTQDCYNLNGLLFSNGWCEYIADDCEFDGLINHKKLKEKDVLAPTIAEVVMWLYESHGIWIYADSHEFGKWCYYYRQNVPSDLSPSITKGGRYSRDDYNSPTEAYEAAITYCLENLIQGDNK